MLMFLYTLSKAWGWCISEGLTEHRLRSCCGPVGEGLVRRQGLRGVQ